MSAANTEHGARPGATLNDLAAAVSRRLMALDPDAAARLERLEGRRIAIRIAGLGAQEDPHLVVRVVARAIVFERISNSTADVQMSGGVFDFVALARAQQRGESIGAGRIEITGDLAVAQDVQALLREFDADIEQWLAGFVGDAAAHGIGRVARGMWRGGQSARRKFEREIAEFLRHEIEAVPAAEDLERFRREVFTLSDDVERVEARLRALEARRSGRG